MSIYERTPPTRIGTAAIGRSLAVMSIVEFADDRVPVVYNAFPVRLGQLIIRNSDTADDVAAKHSLVKTALAEADSSSRGHEVHKALQRAMLLSRTGDELAPGVEAAYIFKAAGLSTPLSEDTIRQTAEINRAYRIYTLRAFDTMIDAAAYEAIQQNSQATAEDWWNQLEHDLLVFDARTI